MRIKQRHVIYVQGYDPRGLAQYYRMFRTELRKFDELYKLKSHVNRPESEADKPVATWTIDCHGPDWRTSTQYDFLHWEDLIKPDFARPAWWTIGYSLFALCFSIFSGGMIRMWRDHWRFVLFLIYPFVLLALMAAAATAVGFAALEATETFGLSPGFETVAGIGASVAALIAFIRVFSGPTYLLYLMADGVSTYQFATGQRPDWDARLDRFAQHVVDVCRTSNADEILIIGHSSGSFMAVEVLARALTLDPDLGRRRSPVSLLTLGANLPIVGYVPAAVDFRNHLQRLAYDDSIRWVDCQSRKDIMNFFPYDPIVGHKLETGAPRSNPRTVAIRFRDLILPEHYATFRLKFFRVHFQFLMANERPGVFDYFMIVAGPLPLMERFDHPDTALAIAQGGDTQKTAHVNG